MTKKPAGEKKPKKKAAAAKSADLAGVSPNAWRFVSRQQIAELLGVSQDTVTDWTSQKELPVAVKGGHSKKSVYDAVAVMKWHRQQTDSKQIDAKEVAQTRAYNAQAEINELKLQRERGTLVDRDIVARDGRAFVKALTSKVRVLPRRFVQIGIMTRDDEHLAADLVREVLTEISSWRTVADTEAAAAAADKDEAAR